MTPEPAGVATALRRAGFDPVVQPRLVAQGWESRIFRCETAGAILAARVHAHPDPDRARREMEMMTELAERGYPVPAVHSLTEISGYPLLVMDFIDGPNLRDAGWPMERTADLCRDLMDRLHVLSVAAPPDDPVAWLRSGTLRLAEAMPRFRPYVDAIWASEPSDLVSAYCHLDFHPGNVLWDGRPWVIDWTGGRVTDPRFDRAWTRLLASMYEPEWVSRFASDGDERWFEGGMALRRLGTVADMLASGTHAAGDELVAHLDVMEIPARWLEHATGIGVPDVRSLLFGASENQSGAGSEASRTM